MPSVTVPSFAKLNLDLRVLSKRADGYHDLRTVFQTISLSDSLYIEFARAQTTQIELSSSVDIPDNLIVRAARLVLDHLQLTAHVRFGLGKKIPMGAGLGGGSSNAAATLIALPALARRRVPLRELAALAESLGSDVPFFLHGGTALGLGRGTEIYPLSDLPSCAVLVVSTGVHVATPQAYSALGRAVTNALTSAQESPILREFQDIVWRLADGAGLDKLPLKNDFESVVFQNHPDLAAAVAKLQKLGASPALMTGSGSAVFGVFAGTPEARKAAAAFRGRQSAVPARFVSRRQYRNVWCRALGPAAPMSLFG